MAFVLNVANIQNNGYYKDSLRSIGTFGQVLSSNGTSTQWITPATPQYASLDGRNVFTADNTFTQPLIIKSLSVTTSFTVNNRMMSATGHSLPLETLAGNFFIPLFDAVVGHPSSEMSTPLPSQGKQKVIVGNINNWINSNYFTKNVRVNKLIMNDQRSFTNSTDITYAEKCIRIIIDDTPRYIQLFNINNSSPSHFTPFTPLSPALVKGRNTELATIGGDNTFNGSNTMINLTVPGLIFTSPSVATPNLLSQTLMSINVEGVLYYIQLFEN